MEGHGLGRQWLEGCSWSLPPDLTVGFKGNIQERASVSQLCGQCARGRMVAPGLSGQSCQFEFCIFGSPGVLARSLKADGNIIVADRKQSQNGH